MPHYVTTKKIPVQERGPQLWGAGTDCVYTQCMTGSTRPLFHRPIIIVRKYQTWKNNGEREKKKLFEIKNAYNEKRLKRKVPEKKNARKR